MAVCMVVCVFYGHVCVFYGRVCVFYGRMAVCVFYGCMAVCVFYGCMCEVYSFVEVLFRTFIWLCMAVCL